MPIVLAKNQIISAKKYVSYWCRGCSHSEVCQIKKVAEHKESHVCQCEQREVKKLITCDSPVCSYCANDEETACCTCANNQHANFIGREVYEL